MNSVLHDDLVPHGGSLPKGPSVNGSAVKGSATRRLLAQARFDLVTSLRNGEQLLVTLVLPAMILVGLARTHVVAAASAAERIGLVAPGVLALAVISSAFTSQAIGTAFDRRAGALRLLGTTPLGRSGLLIGRIGALLCLEVVQVIVLGTVALGLGWRPSLSALPWLAASLVLGTVAFCALGLLLAGTLRAEAVLALANLIWVLLIAGGSVVVAAPSSGWLHILSVVLPSGALGDLARAASLHSILDVRAAIVLAAWAVGAVGATVRWFRWD
jgi:ABC-2 type transport system permease protein